MRATAEAGSRVCGEEGETIGNQPRQRRARRWKKALVVDGKGARGTTLTTMDWREGQVRPRDVRSQFVGLLARSVSQSKQRPNESRQVQSKP